jgi:cytochrome b6-f complex iron-sulfur subunit
MTEPKTSRRSFLSLLLGGGLLATLGAVFYPIFKYIVPPPSGEANVSQLKLPFTRVDIEADPQKSKLFKFGRALGIIVLADDGKLKALSATCTHLDCTVQYRPDLGVIWCACHNGRYTLDGRNVSGPPPRPLEQYAVNEVGEDIFVSKQESSA